MPNPDTNKAVRGQFNTTNAKVQKVLLSLVKNDSGVMLEPSAGSGDLVRVLEKAFPNRDIKAVELDSSIAKTCATDIQYQNFFDFTKENTIQYSTIFGNPPFVAWRDVEKETKDKARGIKDSYSDKTNLYHLFIDKCIDILLPGGELVFIVPKEWLYTTSAAPLRNKIFANGKITHLVDCGEEKLFPDASVPALLIFRFEKSLDSETGNSSDIMFAKDIESSSKGEYSTRALINKNARFILVDKEMKIWLSTWKTLGEHFEPKVGIVSGLDSVFLYDGISPIEPEALKDYLTTQGIKKFIDLNDYKQWEEVPPKAASFITKRKPILMGRKIASFDESNWWMYGAIRNKESMLSKRERFYVYGKTRSAAPFFKSKATLYGGGILGLFKKESSDIKIETAIRILNSKAYRSILEGMFITTGDKASFQPSTLQDLPFPANEAQAAKWILKHLEQ